MAWFPNYRHFINKGAAKIACKYCKQLVKTFIFTSPSLAIFVATSVGLFYVVSHVVCMHDLSRCSLLVTRKKTPVTLIRFERQIVW